MMTMMSISPFGSVGCERPLQGGEMSKTYNHTALHRGFHATQGNAASHEMQIESKTAVMQHKAMLQTMKRR
jgi:hypothetical protein